MADGANLSALNLFLREQGTIAAVEGLLVGAIGGYQATRATSAPEEGSEAESEPPLLGQTPVEPPPAVVALARRLRAGTLADRELRVCSAYRIGRADGLLVARAREGVRVYQTPTPAALSGPNSFFVVLHGVAEAPYWTSSRDRYHNSVRPSGQWVSGAISRGLSTRAEWTAYCRGVGWTPVEQ